jgi:peptidoglycan/LPS O-acetylase OafA/YrhL
MTSPAAAIAAEEDARNPRLDGLRGLAILPVMLYHLTFFGHATSPADQALTFLPSLGWTSVDLFFVLSGYLITGILRRARGSERYLRSFYARRALRIFPLYYGVLFFFFVIAPHVKALGDPAAFWLPGAERETLWYWLYLQNLHVAFTGQFDHHFLGIAWTLSIEEQFYLVWPLVVLFASRNGLIRICAGLIAGAFVLRAVGIGTGAPPLSVMTFTLCRVDTLAAGALLAVLAQDPAAMRRLGGIARRALPVAAVLWLAVVLWARHTTATPLPPDHVLTPDERSLLALAFTRSPWIQTLGYSFDLAFYASLLVSTLAARPGSILARCFESGLLRGFGKYSYAMYLLHLFIAEFARAFYDPNRTQLPFAVEQVLFWCVALALIYAVAAASWYGFESHVLRLKRFFPMGGASPVRAASPLPPREALE